MAQPINVERNLRITRGLTSGGAGQNGAVLDTHELGVTAKTTMPTLAQYGNVNTKSANFLSGLRMVEAILKEVTADAAFVERALRAGAQIPAQPGREIESVLNQVRTLANGLFRDANPTQQNAPQPNPPQQNAIQPGTPQIHPNGVQPLAPWTQPGGMG